MMAVPWADEPYPLIATPAAKDVKVRDTYPVALIQLLTMFQASSGSIYVATSMALAHNIMIRYINSIYLQATGFNAKAETEAFLLYCRAFCTILNEHHDGEEKIFFPKIDSFATTKGTMEQCVEEHHAFEAGFKKFEKYVTETAVQDYRGEDLRVIIHDFGPALLTHLHSEISTLLVVGEKYGGEKIQKAFDEWEAETIKVARSTSNPVSSSTSFVSNLLTFGGLLY